MPPKDPSLVLNSSKKWLLLLCSASKPCTKERGQWAWQLLGPGIYEVIQKTVKALSLNKDCQGAERGGHSDMAQPGKVSNGINSVKCGQVSRSSVTGQKCTENKGSAYILEICCIIVIFKFTLLISFFALIISMDIVSYISKLSWEKSTIWSLGWLIQKNPWLWYDVIILARGNQATQTFQNATMNLLKPTKHLLKITLCSWKFVELDVA